MSLLQIPITVCIIASCGVAVPLIPTFQKNGYPGGRLSLLDWQSYSHTEPEGPGTYAFGYDIEEPQSDNVQFRHEEKHLNGTVTGSYGFVTPDGKVHIINYIADNLGYRASTESRRRGFGKPVKVNDEQDIQDAIAAVNYVKNGGMYDDRNQDYKTKNFDDGNANFESNSNPNYIRDNHEIFNQGATRNGRKMFFPN